MNDLDRVRQIFLTEVDEETRADNEQKIIEWENGLHQNRAMADWQDHDITREVAQKAHQTYTDAAVQLSVNRELTEEQRKRLWAVQDACIFILSLTETDAQSRLAQIQDEITKALNATN